MNTKQSYIRERDQLYADMLEIIHRVQATNRHDSPETKLACQEAWREYKHLKRALRIKYGLSVEGMK